jgi:hypothetical protein
MSKGKAFWPTLVMALAVSAVLVVGATAAGSFVEPGVRVLHELDGTSGSASFGWAVSDLSDVDGDHVIDAIAGEPFNGADFATGSTFVYSGRTGEQLFRYDGAAGDWNGFAMADVGDLDGDHVAEFAVASPGNDGGHVDVYSGATGELVHELSGSNPGETFGWAVSSAGDIDHDHRPDLIIGASQYLGGDGPGHVYIYSGRTFELLRELDGEALNDQFGSGVGWTADVNRDHVPDQIVGARNAGPGDRGQVYLYSGKTGERLWTIDASPHGNSFGSFFVAGVGDVNRDGTPDVYAADYADTTNGGDPNTTQSGRAGVYSGRDGSELLSWLGEAPDTGLGPGRGAGDVNGDGRPDLAIGSFTSSAGAPGAGRVQIFSGADGSVLRTITSTRAGENFGFDAVGIGDTNHDGALDLLVGAATGDHVYVIAGDRRQHGNR